MESFSEINFDVFNFTSPQSQSDFYQEINKDGKKHYLCAFADCGKIFRFKSEYERHKVIHVANRPFVCPHEGCTKAFKREDALKNHVRIHTGELPFKCEMPGCGAKFPTKAGLRYHLLKHKGEGDCVCPHPSCNKTFLTMAQLKQHESSNNCRKAHSHPSPELFESPSTLEFDIKEKSLNFDEIFAPEQKVAGRIEWGTKDQFDSDNQHPISSGLQENFEKMVNAILKENIQLKQRLDMCNKLMNLMQENQDLKQKLSNVPSFSKPVSNNDEDVFSFLNLTDEGNMF